MKTFHPLSLRKKLLLTFLFISIPFLFATKNIKLSVELNLLDSLSMINPTTKTLPSVKFSSNSVNDLDMTPINNMIQVLKVNARPWNTPDFSTFTYSFNVLTSAEYNAQKPADSLPFDCGFVSANGVINVSAPTSASQLAVFGDINRAAVYYLCQTYLYYFYQTTSLPLLLKVGFPAYESRLDPTDAVIRTALNSYGGTFSSFDLLNNPTTFVTNNGFAVAHAFGEFMNIFKNWGYPNITSVNANGFDAVSWWYKTNNLQGLLDDFNRYLYARFLESNEDQRIKLVYESENLRLFSRPMDAAVNFPMLGDSLESAYKEYSNHYGFKAYQKMTGLTLADCAGAIIDGVACDLATLNIGGTAWSSGLSFGCSSDPKKLNDVISLGRHELAHSFEGFMPMGDGTQWLGEGFAFFSAAGPFNVDYSNMNMGSGFWKQLLISSLERGTTFFGHRPTYDDTKVYPGYETDYGYKYLGWYLCDFIFRKGGYLAVKEVMLGDLAGYQKLGYASGQAFMDAYYFDFDVRLLNQKVATLISPTLPVDETSSAVTISWIPLSTSVKLNVAVSTDNGATWTTVAENTTATSCSWNAGSYVGKFKIKISAPDVFDYQTTYGPFNKIDLAKPMINFPVGNEYLIAEDTVNISWANTTLSSINMEFSGDNGTTWSTIQEAVAASARKQEWIVPWIISNRCKIRISDAANASNNDLSDYPFTILQPNEVGGPYLVDKNTVLLMHFDNDLNNRSNPSDQIVGAAQNIVSNETLGLQLGNCYRTTSPVTVPHYANLSLTGDWTIEAWVKPTSFNPNANMYILIKPGDTDSYASNYSLEINPWWGNVFHGFYFSDAGSRNGVSQYAPTLNQWYHIAFIRDTQSAQVKILIHDQDRKLVASQTNSYTGNNAFVNTKDLLIGSGMNGFVDEVRISNINRNVSLTDIPSSVRNKFWSVFPNPSNGLVRMHLQPEALHSELRISNTMGQVVYRQKITDTSDFTLDLTFLSKGMYFVHMGVDGKREPVTKLIIQ
ncbi:MAG TPA: LamG-like jellyroll fold domain-containing protein [Bacteroidales bacterium]|nr:LamG-like jellyroll fold domain-containing protein [Bacteroidales bacterium]